MSFLAKLNNFNILSIQKVKEKQQISRRIYLLALQNFSTITLYSKLKPFVGKVKCMFDKLKLDFESHKKNKKKKKQNKTKKGKREREKE